MKWLLLAVCISVAQQPTKPPERAGTTEGKRSQIGQQADGAEYNKQNPANTSPVPLQIFVYQDHAPSRQADTAPTDEDAQTQGRIVIFTGLLVVVGFLQVAVMFLTWLVYRRQAGIMEQQRATMES